MRGVLLNAIFSKSRHFIPGVLGLKSSCLALYAHPRHGLAKVRIIMTTVISWNVNGIRAVTKNGFFSWLEEAQPDIVCMQESRALPADLTEEQLAPKGYTSL